MRGMRGCALPGGMPYASYAQLLGPRSRRFTRARDRRVPRDPATRTPPDAKRRRDWCVAAHDALRAARCARRPAWQRTGAAAHRLAACLSCKCTAGDRIAGEEPRSSPSPSPAQKRTGTGPRIQSAVSIQSVHKSGAQEWPIHAAGHGARGGHSARRTPHAARAAAGPAGPSMSAAAAAAAACSTFICFARVSHLVAVSFISGHCVHARPAPALAPVRPPPEPAEQTPDGAQGAQGGRVPCPLRSETEGGG